MLVYEGFPVDVLVPWEPAEDVHEERSELGAHPLHVELAGVLPGSEWCGVVGSRSIHVGVAHGA